MGLKFHLFSAAAFIAIFASFQNCGMKPSGVQNLGSHRSQLSTPINVKMIAGGFGHTCILLESGDLYCAGLNDRKQIGVPDIPLQTRFAETPLMTNIAEITAGASHTCARDNDGNVECWGDNSNGQLGAGNIPPRVPNGTYTVGGAVHLKGGPGGTCVIFSDNTISCWGSLVNNTRPTVPFNTPVKDLAIGSLHACAILTDDSVSCWGDNTFGQLGDETPDGEEPISHRDDLSVIIAQQAMRVYAGGFNSCVLLQDNSFTCWGGPPVGLNESVMFPNTISGIKEAALGPSHTCFLRLDDSMVCFGRSSFGQLGDGTRLEKMLDLSAQPILSNVKAISVFAENSCAVLTNGNFKCWGDNISGQLGDGTTIDKHTPSREPTCL